MNRVYSIALLLILVVAPMIPLLMVQASNANPSASLIDDSEEMVDLGVDIPDTLPEGDVELNMMFFTETPSSEDGLYYVCRSGTDSLAYFGASKVVYLTGGAAFTLEFPGSFEVIPQGENPTGSMTNYLLGNDPSKWNTDIADCAVLRYSEIYLGIDLVYKIHDGALKYEFVVAPNANPDLIQMRYPDASMLDVHDDHITVSKSEFAFSDTGLWAFQDNAGTVMDVSCAFQSQDMNTIGFDVGYYEKSQELVIDPILVYSTFLGGSGDDYGYSIAVDDGYVYVTGETASTAFPTVNAFNSTYSGGTYDVFVTKLAADGKSLIYSTFLSGKLSDVGYGIAVESGNAYITGKTTSTDFPTNNAFDPTHNGQNDAFITKLAADGESLLYSTYLGSSDYDYGRGVAVVNDTVYITGYTDSSEFPTTVNAYNSTHSGGIDCFISIFSQDSDSDGVSDWHESYLGTDSFCIDTDNDNFLDGYENAYGSNPLDPMDYPAMPQAWYDEIYEDLNGNEAQILVLTALISGNTDFLNSLNASLYFLNGTYMDDYDGVDNALDEIRDVLDELGISVGDSDYDGLDDLDEISYGTDLLCIDTDVDNLNDAFEIKLGTDPLDDDSDGDTYLDGLEYIAGSDPLDPLSYPGSEVLPDYTLVIVIGAVCAVGIGIVIAGVLYRKRG